MSQSNNENEKINTNKLINEIEQLEDMPNKDNNEKKVKKKFWTTKKVVIFLIIFTIISAGITAGLIYMENSNKQNNVEIIEEKEEIEPDNLGVKSFKDKYFINELEIIEHSYEKEQNKLNVSYVQIDGLKDIELQNKINNEIKSLVLELEKDYTNYESVFIDVICSANFSNVLSIYVHLVQFINDQGSVKNYSLNYNLTTGEYLEFEDLFTNTASIKNIISQSSYTSLASKYLDEEYMNTDTLETDMDTVKNPNLEEEVFRIVNNYISGKKIEFYFSSNYIYLIDDGNVIEIKMADFYESIAIYNRFSKKTGIFESKPTKELYVFLNRYNGYRGIPYYVRIEEIQKGLFVDITIQENENEEINRVYDLYISQLNNEIQNYKEEINKDSTKAMIISLYVYSSQEENGINIYSSGCINYMPMDYYKENMFLKIIDQAQYPNEDGSIEINYYDENFYENSEYFYETRVYDLENSVYYVEEQEDGYVNDIWVPIKKIIKTYNAITGELINEEDLLENEKSHAIMNNMYVQ